MLLAKTSAVGFFPLSFHPLIQYYHPHALPQLSTARDPCSCIQLVGAKVIGRSHKQGLELALESAKNIPISTERGSNWHGIFLVLKREVHLYSTFGEDCTDMVLVGFWEGVVLDPRGRRLGVLIKQAVQMFLCCLGTWQYGSRHFFWLGSCTFK